MSKIEARIVADSLSTYLRRITTFVVTFPRFILAEVNTHRAFSRNSASSRAIPVSKLIEQVSINPAIPSYWGKTAKGMQAHEELSFHEEQKAIQLWIDAANLACNTAREFLGLGVHKQIANRVLEPFMWTTAIITATDLGNFFNLRLHKDAQPEFQELAFKMLEVYVKSEPSTNGRHLPFGDKYINKGLSMEQIIKICVARCARVSYQNFEGEIDHEKDYMLHDSLLSAGHMSPCEHIAFEGDPNVYYGNFKGWIQYRKTLENENKNVFDPYKLLNTWSEKC